MSEVKTHLRQRMTEARLLLLDAAQRIDAETAVASTENPAWRVRDILSHLAASESGLLRTAERFLAGGELPAGFSLDVWNQRQVQKRHERAIEELLAELVASRDEAWALLDRLDEADLQVRGLHPSGHRTTVAGLFHTIANHELAHGNEIRVALGLPVLQVPDWRQALDAEEAM